MQCGLFCMAAITATTGAYLVTSQQHLVGVGHSELTALRRHLLNHQHHRPTRLDLHLQPLVPEEAVYVRGKETAVLHFRKPVQCQRHTSQAGCRCWRIIVWRSHPARNASDTGK